MLPGARGGGLCRRPCRPTRRDLDPRAAARHHAAGGRLDPAPPRRYHVAGAARTVRTERSPSPFSMRESRRSRSHRLARFATDGGTQTGSPVFVRASPGGSPSLVVVALRLVLWVTRCAARAACSKWAHRHGEPTKAEHATWR